MSTSAVIPGYLKPELQPLPDNNVVIQAGCARFTVLTDRLIRLEFHPEGSFEDRASQAFWFRAQPVPDFRAQVTAGRVEIETAYLLLRYGGTEDEGFSDRTLSITLKAGRTVWHPGDPDGDNLRGTNRTLDAVNGYAPLEPGLMSRAGWAVLDDSHTLVMNDNGWIEPRAPGGTDWYFFGYGHDYKACLRDYCRVSGQIPLIPRWILGNWWSRYWAYNQDDLIELVSDFEAYELPFSVCIVDMDWHLTQTGNQSTGWTGYTWNRNLFPDPDGLIRFFHNKGLKTALNLHPAEGIHDHEAMYPEMARRMQIDPATKTPVRFEIENPAFANAYFEVLHHPYEQMGVDFWWLDWQQGLSCTLPGLDPLWLINHLHFYDLGRNGSRRPFIFSRWGREGHQRYPIGFSGDAYRTWATLAFESYMTATASNIAYGWWSHDIGGHTSGTGDSELFTRWVQFGVLSPINRIHVTKGDYYDNRPWAFDDAEVLRVLRDALQFRHALIPYLYTMAYRAHSDSQPLVQPMYYDHPEEEAAYCCPHQYRFGTELIAAPFVTPADPDTGLSRQVIWLPAGDWYQFFTSEHFAGDRWHTIYGRLADIPLFARAGAIVPLGPWNGADNPAELHIHVFAGADHTFTLYEDDGETNAYRMDHACRTAFTQRWLSDCLEFTIAAPVGDLALIPAERTYHIHLHGVCESAALTILIDDQRLPASATYHADTETLEISGIPVAQSSALRITVQNDGGLLACRNRKREKLLHMLRFFRLNTGVRNQIAANIDAILVDPAQLAPYVIAMSDKQARALVEILCEAGVHVVRDTHDPALIILWNNSPDERITYRYGEMYLCFGQVEHASHTGGSVPRFAAFTPPVKSWRHGAHEEHVHRAQWHVQIDYLNMLTAAESDRENAP
jgi:hypothetical protein